MAQNYFQGLLEKLKQDPTGQTGQSSLTSGLLGNPDALIGFGLLQGATQGKNVFEAALPAITQAAQIKKLLTPKTTALKQAFDPKTGKAVFASDLEIKQKGFVPIPKAPLVKVDAGETAEQKGIGEVFGGKFKEINEAGTLANKTLGTLQTVSTLNQVKDLKTGFLGEFKLSANKLAQDLGLDINIQNVSAAETMSAVTGKLVLDGLANFKGAISDGERKFVKDINPGLSMSREGINTLVGLQKRGSNITLKYNEEANDWVERNGGLSKKDKITGKSWSSFTTEFNKKNPLVDDKQRLTLTNLSKQYSPEYLNGNNVQEIDGIKYVKIGKKYFKLK